MRALPAALALCILAPATAAQTTEMSGPAIVITGDTLWVGGHEVRIHGIDAPEAGQKCQLPKKRTWDCSNAAVAALFAIVDRKTVHCVGNEVDQDGRLIARCATDDVPDIGAKLVSSGLAWAFNQHSNEYSALEKGPRGKKLGIWQWKTQPPWEYRTRRRDTASKLATAAQGCPIKGDISAKGERIYHAPSSKRYAKTRIDTSKGERWFCTEAEAKAAGWRGP